MGSTEETWECDMGSTEEKPIWSKACLFMQGFDDFLDSDIFEVIRFTPGSIKSQESQTSNRALKAKADLDSDPYNLRLINDLGAAYALDAAFERCCNVLLRGWKRMAEIEDESVKFHYLMKLSEVSYYLGRFKQAFAVFRDISEPESTEPVQLRSYRLLSVKVHGANGDLSQALRVFKKCVEPEKFPVAVRMWAICLFDLKKAGGYSIAKEILDAKAVRYDETVTMQILDGCAEAADTKREPSRDERLRRYVRNTLAILAIFLLCVLFFAEQASVASLKQKQNESRQQN